jgi:HEPN domain-containing protein
MKQKRYLHGLFWAHLVIEKLAKILWIKNNKANIPPKIHNINRILELANIDLGDENMAFLKDYNKFQLSTRYPDYIENLYKTLRKPAAEHQFETVKKIRTCLLKLMP